MSKLDILVGRVLDMLAGAGICAVLIFVVIYVS